MTMDTSLPLTHPSTPVSADAGDSRHTFWRSERVRRVASVALFEDCGEVQIEHRGSIYRLKQTSLGKLILTK
jgi:hemin uptake protein HemP